MSKPKGSVIKISENFTIRKIDPKEVARKYFEKKFEKRLLPICKVKTSGSLKNNDKNVGSTNSSEIYRFLDRSNNNQIILTTNHALYKYHLNENETKPSIKCKYCKRLISKDPIGLPIYIEREKEEVRFFVIDNFCDFGCCFSFLKRKNCENRIYKGSLYMNAEQLLYCMYYRMYPKRNGESIREKPDWDLLQENGGPLNDEEFDTDNASYISIPSVVTLPSKKQYIKHNLKNARNLDQ